MPLVDQPFATTFTFARLRRADFVDSAGAAQTALFNVPRFDHDDAGAPLGLVIEGRPDQWQPDRLRIRTGDWSVLRGTVLHEYQPADGEVVRRAWYAPVDPEDAVNSCLSLKARHRLIAYVPGLLRNRGGFVRWGRRDWSLGGLIMAEPAVALASTNNLILLEG